MVEFGDKFLTGLELFVVVGISGDVFSIFFTGMLVLFPAMVGSVEAAFLSTTPV